MAQQLFHRSNRLTFAGDDQIEIAKVRIDVESEPMCGNPASNMYAYRRHFAAVCMYARKSFDAKRVDAEIAHRTNQDFFQITDIAMDVFTVRTEVINRVTDQLTQPMISDLTSAISLKHCNASRTQFRLVEQNR